MLIGNMLTDYPTQFGTLVCEVPLLDMTNYHRWLAPHGLLNMEIRMLLKKDNGCKAIHHSTKYLPVNAIRQCC